MSRASRYITVYASDKLEVDTLCIGFATSANAGLVSLLLGSPLDSIIIIKL